MTSKLLTFKGGVGVPGYKELTKDLPIEKAEEPDKVIIPLHQHIGAPCEALVKPGDKVKLGQKIGKSDAFVSSYIHSSVSGTVSKISKISTPTNLNVTAVEIESDKLNTLDESIKPKGYLEDLTSEEIVNIIREAGIVGLGGAGFPSHVKLSPPEDKKIDAVIINGAECEPYLTADHRIMLEEPDKVIFGLRAVMKAVNVDRGIIGIEDNKMDAIKELEKAAKPFSNIEIIPLETKYPQGDEKRLINATLGREVPSGGLPMDVGAVVVNISTSRAICEAILEGKPLYERIVTVTGKGVKTPKNLLVKLGTSFEDILKQCGGIEDGSKVIMGGPMMGIAQYSLDVPSIKTTGGILVLPEKEAYIDDYSACIKCGKCLEVCPVNLQPLFISGYALKNNFEKAEEYDALDCVECGACSYICPAKRPLVHSIRVAKREIISSRKTNR